MLAHSSAMDKQDHPTFWGLTLAPPSQAPRCRKQATLAKRKNDTLTEPVQTLAFDGVAELAETIAADFEATIAKARPEAVFLDVLGISGTLAAHLHSYGLPIVGINLAEAPALNSPGKLADELLEASGEIPADEEHRLAVALTYARDAAIAAGAMRGATLSAGAIRRGRKRGPA